jgi:subtilisin family serine protease
VKHTSDLVEVAKLCSDNGVHIINMNLSGTFMATPHVSGMAALILSSNPALSNEQIRQAMQATALDLGDPGWDVYYGYGLVQAKGALDYLGGSKPGKGKKSLLLLRSRSFVLNKGR